MLFICRTNQTGSPVKRRTVTKKTMSNEDNGNLCAGAGVGASNVAAGLLKPNSSSNEDLSEYTDADESISAPTEVLAEVRTSHSFYFTFCLLPHIITRF